VTVVPVRYSEAAMAALARGILAEAKAEGIPVAGAGPTADFSGLSVAVTAQATDTQRAQLYKLGASEIEVSGQGVPLAGRQSDTSPFLGGGRIVSSPSGEASGVNCSTGRAVRNRTTGVRGLITAKHCGTNTAWYTPSGVLVGTSNSGSSDAVDAMVITGQGYDSLTFYGAWNGNTFDVDHSIYNPEMNATICGDGSVSGEVCNGGEAHVTHPNWTMPDGAGPGFIATTTGFYGLAGNGDSGGPAIAHITGGLSIRGMIDEGVRGTENLHCAGEPNPRFTRVCYSSVFFEYPGTVDAALNVTILLDGA
jgi:streptogrisin D